MGLTFPSDLAAPPGADRLPERRDGQPKFVVRPPSRVRRWRSALHASAKRTTDLGMPEWSRLCNYARHRLPECGMVYVDGPDGGPTGMDCIERTD